MVNDIFREMRERIDKFELSDSHTSEEWQSFFEEGIALIDAPDDWLKIRAIERIRNGLHSESTQHYQQPGFASLPAEKRLPPILAAIARQEQKDQCLLRFTIYSSFSDEQKAVLSEWSAKPGILQIFSTPALETSKIQAELPPADDWEKARPFLEPFFDHSDNLLRAAAAAAFGQMYLNDAKNLPPLQEVMREVKVWEIERPGFAGPFLGQLVMDGISDDEVEDYGEMLQDWILEIIAKRKSDEPCVPFYNGIDFHAHEILSGNPAAVKKLIEFGAESVAAMTATEDDRPIVGMEEHLIRLADSSDDLVARICSWHLACNYRFLHPGGQQRGFVQVAERDDVDIYLVFNPPECGTNPYAATIYPKHDVLLDEIAWKWIDRLIPPEGRPPMENNDWPYRQPDIQRDSTSYVYGRHFIDLFGDSKLKQWHRVWIKWPLASTEW